MIGYALVWSFIFKYAIRLACGLCRVPDVRRKQLALRSYVGDDAWLSLSARAVLVAWF